MKPAVRKAILGVIAACVLLVGVLVIIGLIQTRDEGPYDDAHLMPEIRPVPTDEENALTYFVLAGEALRLAKAEDKQLADIYSKNKWAQPESAAFSQRVADKNREAIALLVEGSRRRKLHYPEAVLPQSLAEVLPPRQTTKVFPIVQVTRLLAARTMMDIRQKRVSQALENVETLLRVGHLLAQESLLGVVVGYNVQELAFDCWYALLNADQWQPEEVSVAWAGNKSLLISDDAMVEALKWTYAERVLPLSEAISDGEKESVEEATGAKKGTPENEAYHFIYRISPFGQYVSQPNRTRRIFAICFSEIIASANTNGRSQSKECPDDEEMFNAENALAPNMLGRLLVQGSLPRFSPIWLITGKHEARATLGEVLLGLRLYQRDHKGKLPPSLGALVPAYLQRVPVSPFDDGPLVYDPEKGVLSVPPPEADPKYLVKPLEVRISAGR